MRSNIRRRLFAITGMLVLATGVVLTNDTLVSEADAAGLTTKPDISACFRWGGVTYASQPVFLQAWYADSGTWKTTRSGNTNASGCVRFNDITVHRYYKIVAMKTWSELCYYYYGETPYIWTAAANDKVYAMGTHYLYQYYWC